MFLLSAVASSIVTVTAAPAISPEMTKQTTQGQGAVPEPKGRLKFKSSGPVCMCAEGLSERDIEQAIAKSKLDKIASPDSDTSVTSHGKLSGQD